MMENEELEVLLAYSEGDGWVKARNYKGEEGYVPQNYLDLHADDQVPASAADAEDPNQNVHQHPAIAEEVEPEEEDEEEEEVEGEREEEEEGEGEGEGEREGEEGAETEAGYPLENQISFSSVDYTYQQHKGGMEDEEDEFPGPTQETTPTEPTSIPPAAPVQAAVHVPAQAGITVVANSDGLDPIVGYCRALYDYDATSDEELTFYEGEVIAILRRSGIHGDDVDDGWWQGQLLPDGPKGVFPSLVVEECGPNGEELTPKVCLTPTVIQRMRIQLKTNC